MYFVSYLLIQLRYFDDFGIEYDAFGVKESEKGSKWRSYWWPSDIYDMRMYSRMKNAILGYNSCCQTIFVKIPVILGYIIERVGHADYRCGLHINHVNCPKYPTA